jgi:hypothetical protein
MDVPDDEVTAAINDAAHNVAIRMHTHEFESVSAAKAPDFVHVVCLANAWFQPRRFILSPAAVGCKPMLGGGAFRERASRDIKHAGAGLGTPNRPVRQPAYSFTSLT